MGSELQTVVTGDQLELIKRTVANGATADELKLYLFDCARQGVHPLDKLVHFTKRAGKYTPVTSIDFMRIRAAETGEYAGNDDAVFTGDDVPTKATVTVWRLVQGQRCAFAATARWSEYKPEQHDFLWRKMPHTMLAKCAEALALRKGFPRQLAGLYSGEEMDQADQAGPPPAPTMGNYATVQAAPVAPLSATAEVEPDPRPPLADGYVRIERIDSSPTKNPSVTKYFITLSTGEVATTINTWLASVAQGLLETGTPARAETKSTKWGVDLVALKTADEPAEPPLPMLTDDEIPF